MTWEACKNYGLIMIEPNGNEVRLYYNMLSSQFAGAPSGFYAGSAISFRFMEGIRTAQKE
jgi:hypothetical protein